MALIREKNQAHVLILRKSGHELKIVKSYWIPVSLPVSTRSYEQSRQSLHLYAQENTVV